MTGRDTLDGTVLSREEAEVLAQKIIGFSNADCVSVGVESKHTANTRFAANQLSTAGAVRDVSIAVQSWFGSKHAVVTSNNLADKALRTTVETSETLARLAPDDPEDMPLLASQTYVPVDAYFDSTANLTPEDRARAAMTALEVTRASGDLQSAGFIVNEAAAQAIANSEGLFAYHRHTAANYTVTVRTADGTGSGWAGADHKDWSKLDFARVSDRAIEKARASRNPVAIEPGRYTVILEPQAVGDLVQSFAFAATARAADEGRSPFVKEGGGNKIGEKILDKRVTIVSDPEDRQLLARPFDDEGLPLKRRVWVENGILKQLVYSRFWAKKQGKEPTGAPTSIKFLGGSTPVDEMIASTERGVLVTRLWYLRQVDPRSLLFTGLTRDGTFLIEDGKISKSIQNFRFNESPLFMLNNLEALGPAVRIAGTERGGDVVMPTIKVRDFNFTSLSEAV